MSIVEMARFVHEWPCGSLVPGNLAIGVAVLGGAGMLFWLTPTGPGKQLHPIVFAGIVAIGIVNILFGWVVLNRPEGAP